MHVDADVGELNRGQSILLAFLTRSSRRIVLDDHVLQAVFRRGEYGPLAVLLSLVDQLVSQRAVQQQHHVVEGVLVVIDRVHDLARLDVASRLARLELVGGGTRDLVAGGEVEEDRAPPGRAASGLLQGLAAPLAYSLAERDLHQNGVDRAALGHHCDTIARAVFNLVGRKT